MSGVVGAKSIFLIEKPRGEEWGTGYPRTIIEVEDDQTVDKSHSYALKVLAPESFAAKWSTVNRVFFIECSGPIRTFNFKQYVEFVHAIAPDISLPKD